ncbi:hypothetical protein MASR2M78_19240 [Treponema sp.]
MLVSDLSYSDYFGRQAIGKVVNGSAKSRMPWSVSGKMECAARSASLNCRPMLALSFATANADPGDIVVLSGIDDVHIEDTICTEDEPKALPRLVVDEPTVSMRFTVNTSPLSGREGYNAQSSKLVERLRKEALQNVSIQVEENNMGGGCLVRGRGEFQLVILIEMLRREGFELSVGRPQVIFKQEGGKKTEPIEHIFVDCAENFSGVVTEKLSSRKGRMINYAAHGSGRVRLEFSAPSRALIGYRDVFLTDTKGTGLLNSYLVGYEEYRGDFTDRFTGSLVADRLGEGVAYGLFNLEPRGSLFILPGEPFYEGMIIGEHNKDTDLDVNPGKTKKLSNMRSVNKDEAVTLTPIQPMTLERALQFIRDDEEVEVTPKSIRLRKRILAFTDRKSARRDN